MDDTFVPIQSAEGWQMSNETVISMAALSASLDIFMEAGIEQIITKSRLLTGYLEFLIKGIESEDIDIITPSEPSERGAQLSIRVIHSDRSLFEEISKQGVIADWREPDVIRIAPAPLYNSFMDVYQFVQILKGALNKP